jgi:hypothetical protein
MYLLAFLLAPVFVVLLAVWSFVAGVLTLRGIEWLFHLVDPPEHEPTYAERMEGHLGDCGCWICKQGRREMAGR